MAREIKVVEISGGISYTCPVGRVAKVTVVKATAGNGLVAIGHAFDPNCLGGTMTDVFCVISQSASFPLGTASSNDYFTFSGYAAAIVDLQPFPTQPKYAFPKVYYLASGEQFGVINVSVKLMIVEEY